MKETIKRNKFVIIGAVCVFLLFAYMTYVTPLLGDDWGFAVTKGNPIELALSYYQTWSGRFFGVIWDFWAAHNPIIFKIVNPVLYTSIFILIYKIVDSNKKALIPLMLFTLFVTVNKDLRMETYTWLAGETFVITLCFSLLYFYFATKIVQKEVITKKDRVCLDLLNIALIILGIMMENISGGMVLGILILLIYDYVKNKRIQKELIVNLIVSVIAFIIIRSSPGAYTRLMKEHADWASLGLIDKIVQAYPIFIKLTFINNNYLILFLSFVLIYLVVTSKNNKNKLLKVILIFIQVIAPCALFSFVLLGKDNIFLQKDSLFSLVYWPIYLVSVIIIVFNYSRDSVSRDKFLFFFIVGGACSVAMMLSPIFGQRSTIYTIFYIFVCILIVLNSIDIDKRIYYILIVICLGLSVFKTRMLIVKYHEVREVTQRRNHEARLAQEHTDDIEAWFTAYPADSVHGGNPDDQYHLMAFCEYFGILQQYQNIVFYYDEDGKSVRLR